MKLRPNAAGGGGLGMRRGWFSRRGDRRGGFRGGFASGGFRSVGIGSGFRGGGFRAAAIGPGFRSAGFRRGGFGFRGPVVGRDLRVAGFRGGGWDWRRGWGWGFPFAGLVLAAEDQKPLQTQRLHARRNRRPTGTSRRSGRLPARLRALRSRLERLAKRSDSNATRRQGCL